MRKSRVSSSERRCLVLPRLKRAGEEATTRSSRTPKCPTWRPLSRLPRLRHRPLHLKRTNWSPCRNLTRVVLLVLWSWKGFSPRLCTRLAAFPTSSTTHSLVIGSNWSWSCARDTCSREGCSGRSMDLPMMKREPSNGMSMVERTSPSRGIKEHSSAGLIIVACADSLQEGGRLKDHPTKKKAEPHPDTAHSSCL